MYRRSLICAALTLAFATPVAANESIGLLVPGLGDGTRQTVASVRERRFAGIVQQKTDFSCGAAVLATLFRDGYAAPVTEDDVLKGMYNVTDPAVVRDRGFSLLDIKNYAKVVGLSAEGYDLPLSALRDLKVPAIVLLDVHGYNHFAILQRADARFAYLADPALGYRILPLDAFAQEWSGVVLVVLGQGYLHDNILARVSPPLGARELLGTAPTALTPQAQSVLMFTGVSATQRI